MGIAAADRLKLHGHFKLSLFDAETGAFIDKREADNLVVAGGLSLLAQAINWLLVQNQNSGWGSPFTPLPNIGDLWAGVGTSSTAPVGTQTQLLNEIGRAIVSNGGQAANQLIYDFFLGTTMGNGAIAEIGAFMQAGQTIASLGVGLVNGNNYSALTLAAPLNVPPGSTIIVGYGSGQQQSVVTANPTIVQTPVGTATTTTGTGTFTISPSQTVPVGDTLVATISAGVNTFDTTTTVTDTKGNTWVVDGVLYAGPMTAGSMIAHTVVTAQLLASDIITVTWKNASVGVTETTVAMRLIDVTGQGTVTVDGYSQATGLSTSPSSGNITTTASYESEIGAMTIQAASDPSFVASAGWGNTQLAVGGYYLESMSRISTAIETRAAAGTMTSHAWVALIATFKSTSAVLAVTPFTANATYIAGSTVIYNFGTMLDRTTFAAITKTSAMTAILEVTLTLVSG